MRRFAAFWLAALAAFIGFLFVFRTILLPFVAGMAIAYALDPLAGWLTRHGIKRIWAATLLLVFLLIFFVALVLVVGPLLILQLLQLSEDIPDYIGEAQQAFGLVIESDFAAYIGLDELSIGESLRNFFGNGGQVVGTFITSLWSGGQALAAILSFLVVTPFVAFYLLSDWPRMISWIDGLLPRRYASEVRLVARRIDVKIARFVRGQLLVGLILGVFYATGLVFIGLDFGLLIGLVAGFVSFVPYLGFAVGFFLSMIVSVAQFYPDLLMPAITLGLFFVGQFIESYVLYPRLLGRQVGMHPVWLFFSLFAFGLLFGFVGLLIAVPAASAVGVVFGYAIERYRDSELYSGEVNRKGPAAQTADE